MRGLGYIPDAHDPRDRGLPTFGLPTTLPAAFSLQDFVVEVLNQGSTSKCVAFSFAQALRIADRVAGVPSPQLSSVDFLYYNSLAYDGGGFVDQGTQMRSCAKGLTKFGRPPESALPFKTDPVVAKPAFSVYQQAHDHRGPSAYARVSGLAQIKQALAASKPVVGGALVGDSIHEYVRGLYDPKPDEEKIGGHALTVVGYDASSFTLVNSWGTGYGESGFMRVSPRFMASFTDCWTIQL